ncbi:MAG: excinuclease ABC subunit UvrC [Lachnospiraceae bacterium]|nr:excinuclease ABC subunit UvrC [Lachnospiraceae bacterium]
MKDFSEELKKLPTEPGVYIMRDENDTIMYVGKAVNLRNRVRSYFRSNIGRGPAIDNMVARIDHFEFIVTDSELEALVLENNLIKEHSPKYNTLLKDDKTYPFIKVTTYEDYPRILFSRTMKRDKSRYFGPYSSAQAVKDTIELLNRIFRLRTCNRKLPQEIGLERPCLNYHIGQCMGPCQGYVSREEYLKQVSGAIDFLSGNYGPIIKDLESKMTEASENMRFEEAARYRDLVQSVRSVAQKQKITGNVGTDRDVIGMARDGEDIVIQIFFVRDGRLMGREHYHMTDSLLENDGNVIGEFIKQFYSGTPFIPREIMVRNDPEDHELIEGWLSEKSGHKIQLVVPKIGTKAKLLEMSEENARIILHNDSEKIKRDEARTSGAVREIGELLKTDTLVRMEAFDISNTNGFENVASMVVFENGRPKRSDYRKFRIKSVEGPNDYACMKEALTRRFTHALEEQERILSSGDEKETVRFSHLPDLLLMDGGRGQVNIALEVLESLGLDIPVCGMVKDDRHRTRGLYFNNTELPIDIHSEGFKLITRIQDEAHRFAIEYHKSLRSKTQTKSLLDDIPGIGPARKKALMKRFQTIYDISNATKEELSALPEIPEDVAESIISYFEKLREKTDNK